MDQRTRHRVLQKVLWSRFGLSAVRAYLGFSRRWDYVVMNRSLLGECNGEHWLLSLLPPAPFIVDVGFNQGDFSREALRRRPEARIVGFDPAASMQRAFASGFAHEPRVELLPFAVGHAPGEAEFHDSRDGNSSLVGEASPGAERYRVEVVTLDEVADKRGWPRIDLLKIDAEGYDLHVLEGAERLLERQAIDIFAFEYNAPWIASRRFLKDAWTYLEAKPYRLFRLFNGFLSPFRYSHRAERHDLGCIYVGVATRRLDQGNIAIRAFPG
ncbi:MAG TPA: FkbM family methyltransferase [Methylomirabilota bacterium]|nr:FkbM family methyltransferase [Methylomirabilota bacterium]